MPSELSQLDTTILQVKLLEPTVQGYLEEHLEELVIKYIVPEIKLIALGMNMPNGFSDGVQVRTKGKGVISIINTWGSPEKPLAKWFNYGTVDHGPKHFNFLHWIDKKTGKHIYAKWVRGVPTTHAMERGIEAGMTRLRVNILSDIKDNVSRKVGL